MIVNIINPEPSLKENSAGDVNDLIPIYLQPISFCALLNEKFHFSPFFFLPFYLPSTCNLN